LGEAITLLRGPVVVRAEEAERVRAQWDRAFGAFDALLAVRPQHAAWVDRLRASGLVQRLVRTPDAGGVLLERVVRVLAILPTEGESLQRLAVRTLGSAHALDRGTPESTLVLSALRGDATADGSPQERRRLWQGVGVALDELSSTV